MAARTPSAAQRTATLQHGGGQFVVGPKHSSITDNHEYIRRYPQLLIADCFNPISFTDTGSSGNWGLVAHYDIDGPDACLGQDWSFDWTAYTWSPGTPNWDIKISVTNDAGTLTDTLSVTSSQTSKIWRSSGVTTDDAIDAYPSNRHEIFFETRFTSGHIGQISIAGFCVWAYIND